MLNILVIIAPMYAVIMAGYLMTRFGLFAKTDMRVFGRFVINIALPALLFRLSSQCGLSQIVSGGYFIAYLVGSLAVILICYLWCRFLCEFDAQTSAFYAMGMSCSNSGFVGYPILLATIAPVAGISLALNMLIENLFVIPLLLLLADRDSSNAGPLRSLGSAFFKLIRNPLIVGLFFGLVISTAKIELPTAIGRTLDVLTAACSALSLFVIGGTLVGLPVRRFGIKVAPIAFGKLVVHPTFVFIALSIMPLIGVGSIDSSLRVAAVLMAGMPIMGIYTALGQNYGKEDLGAVALLVTTLASLVTLSALMWLFDGFILLRR